MGTFRSMTKVDSLLLNSTQELVSFTQLHSDFIREIDVSPLFSNIVVSAGDDGRAVISDVERLVSSTDFPGSTSIHVYNAHQSVSSLSWSRFSSHVCCLTTDLGHFHAFDSRRKGRACTIGAIDTKENVICLIFFVLMLTGVDFSCHSVRISVSAWTFIWKDSCN
jgi:WD40 repeat protein